MSVLIRVTEKNSLGILSKLPNITFSSSHTRASGKEQQQQQQQQQGEFRVLQILPKKTAVQKYEVRRIETNPPRTTEMVPNQDWVSVWPGPRTFHPAVVPLPVRQGYPKKNDAPPSKYGNAELMKIPNFLHLTPPAIQRHCEALKQFCTKWPVGLEDDAKCEAHFPLEYITSDYCYSSPTIREPLARIVSIKVKLSHLKLDQHAKDKILRLLGHRYDPNTDIISIVADRCPTKKQNRDYADYLLTAVYHEAWRMEPWEAEKKLVDMEFYDWDTNKSRETLVTLHAWPAEPPQDLEYENIPNVTDYKLAVTDLINTGEDHFTVNKYREAVKNILHLRRDVSGSQ